MSYYVCVKDGKVTTLPMILSNSEQDSPNSNWGIQQMKLNGYLPCNVDYDPLLEKIDYANPIISGDIVVYPHIALTSDEQIVVWNQNAIKHRQEEYPLLQDLQIALWEQLIENRPQSASAIQQIRLGIKAKYPKK